MKRQRRTFTNEFKNEIVKQILADSAAKDLISTERNISFALLDRWVNDYLAQAKKVNLTQLPRGERRTDYQTVQELKATIADLYMKIDKLQRGSRSMLQPLSKGA